jgi:trans-aconitate methyltransferase
MNEFTHLSQASSSDMARYGSDHNPRYEYLEGLIRTLGLPKDAKVLDIGSSMFTLRLADIFEDVATLGLPDARDLICTMPDKIRHIAFNLNDARDPDLWIELPRFDLIVFAEVIEHLPTAPQQVLRFLANGLSSQGFLVVQTPNAVSLDKRMKMLAGINPYEMIREEWTNPGHFREYTKSELLCLAKESGFEAVRHEFRSYFRSPRLGMRLVDFLVKPFPRLRRGQTAVFRLQSK